MSGGATATAATATAAAPTASSRGDSDQSPSNGGAATVHVHSHAHAHAQAQSHSQQTQHHSHHHHHHHHHQSHSHSRSHPHVVAHAHAHAHAHATGSTSAVDAVDPIDAVDEDARGNEVDVDVDVEPGERADDGARRAGGKGLGWNSTEIIALTRAAANIIEGSTGNSNLTLAQFGSHLRAAFIKDELRPLQARSGGRDGGALDMRRWDGRSIPACLKRWGKIKELCTRFHAAVDKVRCTDFANGPLTEHEIERCATLIYNDGNPSVDMLHDVLRQPNYPVGKQFPFLEAFRFMLHNTSLLTSVDANTDLLIATKSEGIKYGASGAGGATTSGVGSAGAAAEVDVIATVGGASTALATGRTVKVSAGEDGLATPNKLLSLDDSEMLTISASRLTKSLANKTRDDSDVARQQLALRERQLNWEMARVLFGPDSDAPEDEKQEVRRLLRKSVLRNLRSQSADDSCSSVGTKRPRGASDSAME